MDTTCPPDSLVPVLECVRGPGPPGTIWTNGAPLPRRILNADKSGWVLIGEYTSDNGVHVRGKIRCHVHARASASCWLSCACGAARVSRLVAAIKKE